MYESENKSIQRILIFGHDASLYGASLSMLTLVEYIVQNPKYKVLVFLPYKGLMEQRLTDFGVDYQIIPFPRCITQSAGGFPFRFKQQRIYKNQLRATWPQLKNLADAFGPDLIYTNTSVVSAGYHLAKALQVPHIWHIREYGDLDYHFRYLPSRKTIARYIADSEVSIFVSAILQKHWLKKPVKSSRVIPNGIAELPFELPRKFPSGPFRFGLLGACVPGKGQDIAIQALALINTSQRNAQLHLYGTDGDPAYIQSLKALAYSSGMSDNITFHPFVENNSVIYKSLDVVLNCSSNEGFGRTVIEAMHFGIPVIANASGGPLEIIENEVSGLLYRGTAASLSEAMVLLMENTSLYEQLAINGKERATERYTSQHYLQALEDTFIEIIKKQ